VFGNAPLEAITPAAIDRWRRRLLADRRLSQRSTMPWARVVRTTVLSRAKRAASRRLWNLNARNATMQVPERLGAGKLRLKFASFRRGSGTQLAAARIRA
jgi:hypothetical protein